MDLWGAMRASRTELTSNGGTPESFELPFGTGTSKQFVVTPSGIVFVQHSSYHSDLYEKLEDVLAKEIVQQR